MTAARPDLEPDLIEARAVLPWDALQRVAPATASAMRRAGFDMVGPCPVAGGEDGFAVHARAFKWNCRKCGEGGRDSIGLAAHALGLDVRRRDDLARAVAAVLGRPVVADRDESDADRRAREEHARKTRARAEADAKRREADENAYRKRSRDRAAKIWRDSVVIDQLPSPVTDYLAKRARLQRDHVPFLHLRAHAFLPYALDRQTVLHRGPAMVGGIWSDVEHRFVGAHATWIDMAVEGKFRPVLMRPKTGKPLASKKMQGSHKGCIIPLAGKRTAQRWVVGEGIENVIAVAVVERFRADTFYASACTLGNLAGPADPESAFFHPTETTTASNGIVRRKKVPGPVPAAAALDPSASEAFWAPDHVTHVILLADADSERVFTASAMTRCRTRLTMVNPHRQTSIIWPKPGFDDFSDWVMSGTPQCDQSGEGD